MSQVTLIYPHQLFSDHPAIEQGKEVFLIEDELFFNQYAFHVYKLVYHKASMAAYAAALSDKGVKNTVIRAHDAEAKTEHLFRRLAKSGVKSVRVCDPDDYLLERRLKRYAHREGIQLQLLESPLFLCDWAYVKAWFNGKKRLHLTTFYIEQRQRFRILLDENEKPIGDKWTYDTENRKKLPKGTRIPALPSVAADPFWTQALKSVKAHFPHNPGKCQEPIYPYTHQEANAWLMDFIRCRFASYGDFQDAIASKETFLFHSILTPMLNTGLLTPETVIDCVLQHAETAKIPMNALEGFIRQVIGWREFVRFVYRERGVKQRTGNFFSHTRRIPESLYSGTTGIPPVDDAIHRTLETGYTHHIERLMVLGNFMVLCEFDPDEVYRWFMELYIDAYDWVMVPNVYGMSQFADGGLMSTKPYISGSNYLLKMSDYTKGDWCEIWDALYWRFIHKHRTFFLRNPRMSMMVRQVEKMEPKRFEHLMQTAEDFLAQLDKQTHEKTLEQA
ncbi:MAG: cryptochrome/photolyase family protein [Bacteroidota bacterium]